MSTEIPNLIDDDFENELLRRYSITGDNRSIAEIKEEIERDKTVLTFGYENETYFSGSDYEKTIGSWLKGP